MNQFKMFYPTPCTGPPLVSQLNDAVTVMSP